MTDAIFPPSAALAGSAHIDASKYDEMYAASVTDTEAFWGEHGKRLDWIKPYSQVKDTSFAPAEVAINWYADGTLNVCGQLH